MKEFIGAVTALILCASAVIFSCFYTADSLDRINEAIEDLPRVIDEDISKDTSEELLGCVSDSVNILQSRLGKLSLFITHKELDELEAMLYSVGAAIDSRDTGHYASSVASLRERLEKLAESEAFSLSAIF